MKRAARKRLPCGCEPPDGVICRKHHWQALLSLADVAAKRIAHIEHLSHVGICADCPVLPDDPVASAVGKRKRKRKRKAP